jgi:predicted RNA-binding protein YlqC (UPF0109 family)
LFAGNAVVFQREIFNLPKVEDKEMKDLIEYIAKSLVDQPDVVKVLEVEGERTSVIELSVAKEDLGKVIGKQGKTARAMRTILSAASTKQRKRTILEIIE